MTPEERQELRDWSARLKGWIEGVNHGVEVWIDDKGSQIPRSAWTPDLPTAPAWQILSVIDRMRELGWQMQAWMMADDFRVAFYKTFKDWRELRQCDYTQANTLQEAVLLAAKATGEE